jgi:hypothetical protein
MRTLLAAVKNATGLEGKSEPNWRAVHGVWRIGPDEGLSVEAYRFAPPDTVLFPNPRDILVLHYSENGAQVIDFRVNASSGLSLRLG